MKTRFYFFFLIVLGATIDPQPTLVPSVANSYQSTSDSADSPITSPGATQCHSPTDHLLNGSGVASPANCSGGSTVVTVTASTTPATNSATAGVLIMSDISQIDEDSYRMTFKQEPNGDSVEHAF